MVVLDSIKAQTKILVNKSLAWLELSSAMCFQTYFNELKPDVSLNESHWVVTRGSPTASSPPHTAPAAFRLAHIIFILFIY